VEFEKTITLDDLEVILKDVMLLNRKIFLMNHDMQQFHYCTVIDFNQKSKTITIVFRDQSIPVIYKIPIETIEIIEFDFFYSYKGISAKTFIIE
jgi:hypothetical protein